MCFSMFYFQNSNIVLKIDQKQENFPVFGVFGFVFFLEEKRTEKKKKNKQKVNKK